MKVLQLTHKPPIPSVDGGCLAMHQITTCLISAGVEVKVVSISTAKHPVIQSDVFIYYRDLTHFESVFIDTKITPLKILLSVVRRNSLQANRFVSGKLINKLETLLLQETFDVVIFESIFVGNYIETIRKHSQASILLRVHNVEHLIWERLSKQANNPIKKLAYKYLSNSLKRFELSLFKKIDGYLPITDVDHNFFNARYPNLNSKVIPFCINLPDYPHKEHTINKNNISLFHIGSMNWQPNIEGMNWFLNNVWAEISKKHPNLKLVLAGKGNKTVFAKKYFDNIQIFDFVEDAQQFMNVHDILIVPLLSGSGMRIKIMEGLALGKPIITTTIGAEGINVTDKENILIADTPEQMIQAIDFCINNVQKIEEIGKNARKLIENQYTQEIISRALIEILKNINSNPKVGFFKPN